VLSPDFLFFLTCVAFLVFASVSFFPPFSSPGVVVGVPYWWNFLAFRPSLSAPQFGKTTRLPPESVQRTFSALLLSVKCNLKTVIPFFLRLCPSRAVDPPKKPTLTLQMCAYSPRHSTFRFLFLLTPFFPSVPRVFLSLYFSQFGHYAGSFSSFY